MHITVNHIHPYYAITACTARYTFCIVYSPVHGLHRVQLCTHTTHLQLNSHYTLDYPTTPCTGLYIYYNITPCTILYTLQSPHVQPCKCTTSFTTLTLASPIYKLYSPIGHVQPLTPTSILHCVQPCTQIAPCRVLYINSTAHDTVYSSETKLHNYSVHRPEHRLHRVQPSTQTTGIYNLNFHVHCLHYNTVYVLNYTVLQDYSCRVMYTYYTPDYTTKSCTALYIYYKITALYIYYILYHSDCSLVHELYCPLQHFTPTMQPYGVQPSTQTTPSKADYTMYAFVHQPHRCTVYSHVHQLHRVLPCLHVYCFVHKLHPCTWTT